MDAGCRVICSMSSIRVKQTSPSFKAAAIQNASDCIGALTPGCRIIGLTKGQFSLIDLVRSVLVSTGPAHLMLSTWTTGIRDAENIEFLCNRGDILSLKLLTDRSFPGRKPEYVAAVRRIFGDESIRITRTHAKFALIENDQWHIAIRSSMNLNRNPRFEQFDLDDSEEICEFFRAHFDELSEMTPAGLFVECNEVDKVFRSSLGGGLSDVYSLDDDACWW